MYNFDENDILSDLMKNCKHFYKNASRFYSLSNMSINLFENVFMIYKISY